MNINKKVIVATCMASLAMATGSSLVAEEKDQISVSTQVEGGAGEGTKTKIQIDGKDVAPAPQPSKPIAPLSPNNIASRMEEFRKLADENLKQQLKATDEEWKTIQPLIEKIRTKQKELSFANLAGSTGMTGGLGRFSSPPPPAGTGDAGTADRMRRPPPVGTARVITPEMDELKKIVEVEDSSNADLKAKMEALRDAREKAAKGLKDARNDLRKVVQVRQEAILLVWGILD